MKFLSNIFIPFALSVILTAGCSKQERNTESNSQPVVQSKPEPQSEPKTEAQPANPFTAQLTQFLSSASHLAAASPTGISISDLINSYSFVKEQFDLLDPLWPTNFCQEAKTDIQEALKGWSYASSGPILVAGRADANAGADSQLLYAQLCQYETNPFGILFTHCTNAPHQNGDCIYLTDTLHRINPDLYG